MCLNAPDTTVTLAGDDMVALPDPSAAVRTALAAPVGCPPLAELVSARKPKSVAITVSDITRPVPNRVFLPIMLDLLNAAGVPDSRIIIIIGTGLHRPSTPAERDIILGGEILKRVEVIDHMADRPDTLKQISAQPPISVNQRFADADFRIVTGLIEPHFMAGFSGGRKGVCPALVDLATLQRFHGYATLADPNAENGRIENNPCHAISLHVAKTVGVDFLLNVTINRDRAITGIYCGEIELAHARGCAAVRKAVSATVESPFDLVITNGGGFPLDQTFYQTVKGMCAALPALHATSKLMIVSHCGEGLGSPHFAQTMLRYSGDWRTFLADIARTAETRQDQWQFQMQARVLERIGVENLWFVSDGIPADVQTRLAVTPVTGSGSAQERAQRALDAFSAAHPHARIAVMPEGPYVLLQPAARA